MKILLFSKPDCAPCDQIKLYFKNKNIFFEELIVTDGKNAKIMENYRIMSVPTVVIITETGQKFIKNGFSAHWLDRHIS